MSDRDTHYQTPTFLDDADLQELEDLVDTAAWQPEPYHMPSGADPGEAEFTHRLGLT